ncbi:hypothetical protein [Burkholderia ubonensis]|uniref:hypothetical protein n=1 Tax=Burkholderia ubonensis TaxID=101571 RepID=UPI0012FBE288|nr:hypothetical protein [Burkholderia ubonensis]
MTTVAVAVAPVVSAEPIAPTVLPAAPASAPPTCDSAAGPFASAPVITPAGLPSP